MGTPGSEFLGPAQFLHCFGSEAGLIAVLSVPFRCLSGNISIYRIKLSPSSGRVQSTAWANSCLYCRSAVDVGMETVFFPLLHLVHCAFLCSNLGKMKVLPRATSRAAGFEALLFRKHRIHWLQVEEFKNVHLKQTNNRKGLSSALSSLCLQSPVCGCGRATCSTNHCFCAYRRGGPAVVPSVFDAVWS